MYDSDRKYLSRFALDPQVNCGWEDLDGFDFSYDDDLDLFDDVCFSDSEDLILKDDFSFEN
jgi:hypothetical protein